MRAQKMVDFVKKTMDIKHLKQKANNLQLKASVTNNNQPFEKMVSPEYVIKGSTVFQVQIIAAYNYNNGYTRLYNNLIFVRFTKQRRDDGFTYIIKLTSSVLGIKDKCITSDEGTWHLIYENKQQQFSFDVSVTMEVVPSVGSFASLRDDTELTDFELRGEDGFVMMHRAVLAAASPVLRRMLGGEWRETSEGHVNLPNTSKDTLEHFKNYLYLNTLPESGLEQLLLLSSYYIMPDLEQKCVDKLVQTVDAATACDLIEFATKHKVTPLLLGILDCVQSGVIKVSDMRDHFMRVN